MIYSCAYPIYHTFIVDSLERIEYTVSVDGVDIYRGMLYPKNLKPLRIDLSTIFREYLSTNYEDKISDITGIEYTYEIKEFEVSEDGVADSTKYKVKYDYNLDYISELPNTDCLAEPIVKDVDINQHLFMSGYSIDSTYGYIYSVNGLDVVKKNLSPSNKISMLNLNLKDLSIKPGDRLNIKFHSNGKILNDFNYRVINPCNNRYVLHYVNTKGGLDGMLCSGKAELKYGSKSTEVAINDSYLDRKQFSHLPISSKITKSYTLNTGILTDERAALIYNVIDSPKVWIEDINEGTITACIITENNKTVKTYKNDKIVSYSISLEESQKYIRK